MLCTTAGAGGVVGLGLGDGDPLGLADARTVGVAVVFAVAPTALPLAEAVGADVDDRELGRPSVPGGAASEQAAKTSTANASAAVRITAARDRMRAPRGIG